MTTGEMLQWTERFNNITERNASIDIKNHRLANLMTDLECIYDIPMLRNEKFEKANPYVMQLYRSVSEARVFG